MKSTAAALVGLVGALVVLPAGAIASIYMAGYSSNTDGARLWIGRANLDGRGVRVRFVPEMRTGCGLAIDRRHMYWINQETDTFGGGLGRANLDGTGVNQKFIVTSPAPTPTSPEPGTVNQCGVAVDSAHVYWATDPNTYQPDSGVYTHGPVALARAGLDGSHVNQAFIANIAPDTSHLSQNDYPTDAHDIITAIGVHRGYIYWANFDAGTIGRARLDGSAVNQNFIIHAYAPSGIAFDARHIYWSNSAPVRGRGDNTIGRADLDGTRVNQRFISGPVLGDPCGLAVFAAHLYWSANCRARYAGYGGVGRADLNGRHAIKEFVSSGPRGEKGAYRPDAIAVDGKHPG